jgi:OmcA/MtrC family decaheme c-type cytochrome
VEYELVEATGSVTELLDFGNGDAVLISFTTDFELPSTYPLTLNDGPDLGERQGGWSGKGLVDGTYSLALWARRDLTLSLHGESNSYRELSRGVHADFLVGDATTLAPYALISSEQSCNACHVDLVFHGRSRRGLDTCLACHALAAAGDRPRYVAGNAPATDGVTIDFAQLLHKVHRGKDLAHAESYTVVGFGGAPWPNNFGETSFEHVAFPAMPSGTKDCRICHGEGNEAWIEPSDLDHPTEQFQTAQEWRLVCGSCHDSDAAQAHIGAQTEAESGAESCAICHGVGQEWAVEVMHRTR